MFTSEARQAISCAAARMDSGGRLSTIIKARRRESPPDIGAPRRLSATEPVFPLPWGEARLGLLNVEMPSPPSTRPSDARNLIARLRKIRGSTWAGTAGGGAPAASDGGLETMISVRRPMESKR
jgi:hypothetical protein